MSFAAPPGTPKWAGKSPTVEAADLAIYRVFADGLLSLEDTHQALHLLRDRIDRLLRELEPEEIPL